MTDETETEVERDAREAAELQQVYRDQAGHLLAYRNQLTEGQVAAAAADQCVVEMAHMICEVSIEKAKRETIAMVGALPPVARVMFERFRSGT